MILPFIRRFSLYTPIAEPVAGARARAWKLAASVALAKPRSKYLVDRETRYRSPFCNRSWLASLEKGISRAIPWIRARSTERGNTPPNRAIKIRTLDEKLTVRERIAAEIDTAERERLIMRPSIARLDLAIARNCVDISHKPLN